MAKHTHSQNRHNAKSSPQKASFLEPRPFAPPVQREVQPQAEEEQQKPQPGLNLLDLPHLFDPRPLTPPPLQAKLTIGEPDDQYEQEADHVARQVVDRIHSPQTLQQKEIPETVQREEMPEEEELQMKPLVQRQAGGEASEDLDRSIQQARGSGQALDKSLRPQMEQAMGADFSGVRVHTDPQSDRMSRSIQAKAFTTGQDIFFKQGEYNPGTKGGQELVAHELTHVMQQNGETVQRQGDGVIQRRPLVTGKHGYAQKQEIIDYLTSSDRPTPLKEDIAENFVEGFLDTAHGKYSLTDVYRVALEETGINNEVSDTNSNEDDMGQDNESKLDEDDDNNDLLEHQDDLDNLDEEVSVGTVATALSQNQQEFTRLIRQLVLLDTIHKGEKEYEKKKKSEEKGFEGEYQESKQYEEDVQKVENYSDEEVYQGCKTTCDVSAYAIMAGTVGIEEIEKLKAKYNELYNQRMNSQLNNKDWEAPQTEKNGQPHGKAYLYLRGEADQLKQTWRQWLNANGRGVMQVKYDHKTSGPHTFVIERNNEGQVALYQSYESKYSLLAFLTGSDEKSPEHSEKVQNIQGSKGNFVDPQEIEDNQIQLLCNGLGTPQQLQSYEQGNPPPETQITSEQYKAAFGSPVVVDQKSDDQYLLIGTVALFVYDTIGTPDINSNLQQSDLDKVTYFSEIVPLPNAAYGRALEITTSNYRQAVARKEQMERMKNLPKRNPLLSAGLPKRID